MLQTFLDDLLAYITSAVDVKWFSRNFTPLRFELRVQIIQEVLGVFGKVSTHVRSSSEAK